MSGFDNWNKKTSDYLEEIFDKNHKNIDFDMWDELRNQEKQSSPDKPEKPAELSKKTELPGFSVAKNSHCVVNGYIGFSYGSGYAYSYFRFKEVFGDSFTYEIYLQMAACGAAFFGGNCFGMSATASLAYEKRLQIPGYISSDKPLPETGYDQIMMYNGYHYTALKSASELTKVVERYQIWQYSTARTAIIFDTLQKYKKNQAFFKWVLNGIRDSSKSYILSVHWKQDTGRSVGHALVVDSFRKPVRLDNGSYRIYLYDPNNPYYDFQGKQAMPFYRDAENRYIDVNPDNGSWGIQLQVNVSGSGKPDYVGQNADGTVINDGCMYFIETDRLPNNFLRKATFRNFFKSGTAIIRYRSNDFAVSDMEGSRIYQMNNGSVRYLDHGMIQDFPYEEYTASMMGENTITDYVIGGQLVLRDGKYSVVLKEGSISYSNDQIYAGIVSGDEISVEFSDRAVLKLRAKTPTTVNVVIQEGAEDSENCITYSTDIKVGPKNTLIGLHNHNLHIESDIIQNIDVKSTTRNGTVSREKLNLDGELLVREKEKENASEW